MYDGVLQEAIAFFSGILIYFDFLQKRAGDKKYPSEKVSGGVMLYRGANRTARTQQQACTAKRLSR